MNTIADILREKQPSEVRPAIERAELNVSLLDDDVLNDLHSILDDMLTDMILDYSSHDYEYLFVDSIINVGNEYSITFNGRTINTDKKSAKMIIELLSQINDDEYCEMRDEWWEENHHEILFEENEDYKYITLLLSDVGGENLNRAKNRANKKIDDDKIKTLIELKEQMEKDYLKVMDLISAYID